MHIRAEVITVGTEILLGEILNTNARYLSKRCAERGVDIYHHVTVGDNRDRLRECLSVGRSRADLILVTGGIGPTPDDITREAVADVWGRKLSLDPNLLHGMQCFYAQRSLTMSDNNRRQALIPEGAVPLRNEMGTAPGFFLRDAQGSVACLPGPPGEMEAMFSGSLIPLLEECAMLPPTRLFSCDIRTAGIGESALATEIDFLLRGQSDPTIATYAGEGMVRIRLTTRAHTQSEAHEKFAPVICRLEEILGSHIYGFDDETLPGAVGDLLRHRGLTLAVAESCTGGMLAEMITEAPGASDYFSGGIICYANEVKMSALGVGADLLREFGAVSEPVAAGMAEGVMRAMDAGVSVAVTGVAGPAGGSREKPVGTVVFAFGGPWGVVTGRRRFSGSRHRIRRLSAISALVRLRELILQDDGGP